MNVPTQTNESTPFYFAAWIKKDTTCIRVSHGEPVELKAGHSDEKRLLNELNGWIERIADKYKPVAATIYAPESLRPIISQLWLVHDIIPVFNARDTDVNAHSCDDSEVDKLAVSFDENTLIPVGVLPHNEVKVHEVVTFDEYKKVTPTRDIELLLHFASKMKGKSIVFIGSSWQGGGVALMRHALVRLLRLLGVDVHWCVLKPSKSAFDVTKNKFHNVLQNVAAPDVRLTQRDCHVYESWIRENAEILESMYTNASVVVIDDPQPSGLIPYIRKANPAAKIIFRSHIHIEASLTQTPGTPQYETWQYIWQFIHKTDLYISHPVPSFVPADIPEDKVMYMPATTDTLDGLNKSLSPAHISYYRRWFDRILTESEQPPLENNPYIVQIARFDPSKGIPDVLKAYGLLASKLKAGGKPPVHCVICGHGAVDDPEGLELYTQTLHDVVQNYAELSSYIKVALVPPSDQLLNALLRGAMVALQLSYKEGFEVKVTEALMKGVPVVAYATGGIPLQIQNGHNGYLVAPGDTERVAGRLYDLITDTSLLSRMKKDAVNSYNPDTSTVANAINWLYLVDRLHSPDGLRDNRMIVRESIDKSVQFTAGA